MTTLGKIFVISAPKGWLQFQDRGREVFQGPSGEELIVSAAIIQGFGQSVDLKKLQQQLFDNAESSLKRAGSHPDLAITQPFKRDISTEKVECWRLYARTKVGDKLFYQALFRDSRGVLIATFEAPNTKQSIESFEEFIESVDVVSGS